MSDQELEKGDSGRRDFLKKSLVAGAVVWGAPAVTSLPAGRAWAQTYPPPACACNGDAFGLSLSILGGAPTVLGVDGCVVNTGVLGVPNVVTVAATAVCGSDTSSVDGGCSGLATIATADVIVGPTLAPTLRVTASVIESVASASCSPCATTGTSTIARLQVNGTRVNATSACNQDVLGLGLVFLNEQSCDGETLSVNAIHIVVPGIIDLILAHAEAGAEGCTCTPCA